VVLGGAGGVGEWAFDVVSTALVMDIPCGVDDRSLWFIFLFLIFTRYYWVTSLRVALRRLASYDVACSAPIFQFLAKATCRISG
jgi:hypothetical protein